MSAAKIIAVVPAYNCAATIAAVLRRMPPLVSEVVVVDDASADDTSGVVSAFIRQDARVHLVRHTLNQGVGGAVVSGFKYGLARGGTIFVKVDGDGQMDPEAIPLLVQPLLRAEADYVKGNRFFDLAYLKSMPWLRLLGNSALSFLTKLSSGYWQVMDPTNGFVAIHRSALARLPLDRLERRYFFESDMLYQLGLIRAVVADFPMAAVYNGETSHLSIPRVALSFPTKHLSRLCARIIYSYFIRDFNLGTLCLSSGLPMTVVGVVLGVEFWRRSALTLLVASSGTVMLAALPIMVGSHLLIGFLNYEVSNSPRQPLSRSLPASVPQGGHADAAGEDAA